jgi:hypothetical protein
VFILLESSFTIDKSEISESIFAWLFFWE